MRGLLYLGCLCGGSLAWAGLSLRCCKVVGMSPARLDRSLVHVLCVWATSLQGGVLCVLLRGGAQSVGGAAA